ncbi:hypothetical protein COLO4_32398 [Corchorus olitorius]|uniref:Late embryogenesis abundant protein, LEA-14 n=1 Tax=Corchorus olitorius TaxID=93759 RepID=A0A1R3GZD8_9ROSI|nr:hypothetical protein COLO4_32398 [Corchorus olitorius]
MGQANVEKIYAYSFMPQDPSILIPLRRHSLPADHHSQKRRSLGALFAEIMFIMFISMIVIVPILFLIMNCNFAAQQQGPQLPPDSFSVSNFHVSDSKLSATWELDLAFLSQGNGHEIQFSGIEGTIFYKDIALAMTSWQPFGVGMKEQEKVHLKFVTSGYEGDQPIVENSVLREIKEEQNNGTVRFSMRINTFVAYQNWGLFWRSSNPGYDSYCWDLIVRFSPKTGTGKLFGGDQKECQHKDQ